MKILSSRFFRKNSGGAVMFQVLLGLGLMVLMSPMVFRQIKKYNQEIAREEVVHDLEKWQKAASSFVIFEKDIPEQIKGTSIITGDQLKSKLSEYLPDNTPTENSFGQTYGMITIRPEVDLPDGTRAPSDQVEAVVFAYGGSVPTIELNGIGQFLFDKGAVMDADGQIYSNLNIDDQGNTKDSLRISTAMKSALSGKGGLLFMYVSDAYFVSDYLYSSPMPGVANDRSSFVNTMIVDLDMGGKDMTNVKNFYTQKLNGVNMFATQLSVSELNFKGPSEIENDFEYQNTNGISVTGGKLPVTTTGNGGYGYGLDESKNLVDVDELEVSGETRLDRLFIKNANINGIDATGKVDVVSGKGIYVRGNVDIAGNVNAKEVFANTVVSDGSNAGDWDVVDKVTILSKQNNSSEDSYIYIGSISDSGELDEDISTIIVNFDGFSEADDICRVKNGVTTCLSNILRDYYDRLQRYAYNYYVIKTPSTPGP